MLQISPMRSCSRILLSSCLLLLTHCAHSNGPALAEGPAPVVETGRGPVQGLAYADGGAAFLGIPFAQPPTGERRWRAPEPAAAWSTPRDASRFGSPCPQADMRNGKPIEGTSEDCLTLNVWTPALEPQKPAPVMVYIHGGAFTLGSSRDELYDGSALAHAGVVVVSMNYRLGALGFLAHPALGAGAPAESSGNYGLMDQRLALEWVRDHVSAFGGDPTNVTLFGESAGAISACLQMVSPAAQGLFHRVIAESGTCYLTNTPLKDPGTPEQEDSAEERGVRFAREVGCTEGDIAACLRTRTPEQLLAASGAALDLLKPRVGFGPVVDGNVIPAAPRQLLAEGKYARVPLLLGSNRDEGTIFTLQAKIDTPEQYEAAVNVRVPGKAEPLLRAYPAKDFTSPKAAFSRLLGDAMFVCPTRQLARTLVEQGQPVHAYFFTYEPKKAFGSIFGRFLKLGAYHSAELPFVFGLSRGRFALDSDSERELSTKLIGYWTRFATGGNPNTEGAVQWPAYTREEEKYLEINTELGHGSNLNAQRCDMLDSLGL
ncbi:putative carboxylesterase [Cystobacter fuscus DSM 2262]|uniref:Carboxylic ester hydrolase n=1 Tax=Cystobacter fuscus (strain ATCC 25194 / DSM 2262 / NBRC 100088 / M29) TaxID=1242864 RepID=S9P793_CYSF2|nr:carboxylesterase/lipase family protein [Cystobacter fuscus]EPX60330.1 putative carboxylesterase [Cystobacter fuscus DSM 2262]